MSGRTGRRLFARAAATSLLSAAASVLGAEKRVDNPLKHFADQIGRTDFYPELLTTQRRRRQTLMESESNCDID